MSKTFVITGASGHVGKVLTDRLLSANQKVRVIARDANKMKELIEKGAELQQGDVRDGSFVNKAFSGADAVFLMIPPPHDENNILAYSHRVMTNYLDAVKSNNVKHVVLLSSIGTHDLNTKNVVEGLKDAELEFHKLDNVNFLALRPSSFMENLMFQVPVIKQMGIAGSAVKGDLSMPWVATKDIAEIAAKRLLDLSFTGKSHEYILGERNFSYNEATKILGPAIGMPDLQYVTFPYDQAEQAMLQFLPPDYAHRMVQMSKDMNEGEMLKDYTRSSENTTPTSIEEFSKTFAAAYNADAAATN
ncbi:MAG: NAD(P)H-binding protein [Chitinophagales bacterium]|nr:NAD(P)H-binding protein [Chitinophagales bacterium]